jgi:hypothetical protein
MPFHFARPIPCALSEVTGAAWSNIVLIPRIFLIIITNASIAGLLPGEPEELMHSTAGQQVLPGVACRNVGA